MAGADPPFPECCATCPHRNSFTASCTHELRQTVMREVSVARAFDDRQPCPVYRDEKTEAMRELAESL